MSRADEDTGAVERPEADDAAGAAERARMPFFDVVWTPNNGARVRAGVMTSSGDVERLVLETKGLGLARVGAAVDVAIGWCADVLTAGRESEDGEAE